MTQDETVQILSVLKAAYPNSYKGMTRQEAYGTISVWATQFAQIPVQIVLIAVNKLISTSTYPPTISEVKAKLKDLYYEATIELTTKKLLNPKDIKTLQAIQKYCFSNNTEPSLVSLLSSNQVPMIESNGGDSNE